MPRIRYVDDDGETVEQELISRRAAIFPGSALEHFEDSGFDTGLDPGVVTTGDEFRPTLVERVEFDHEGGMSSITTVCGETENRRESDKKPRIVVEGIAVEDDLSELRRLKTMDSPILVSDVFQGEVEVRRVTVEQNTDLIEYIPENGEPQLAFSFQLQFRQP